MAPWEFGRRKIETRNSRVAKQACERDADARKPAGRGLRLLWAREGRARGEKPCGRAARRRAGPRKDCAQPAARPRSGASTLSKHQQGVFRRCQLRPGVASICPRRARTFAQRSARRGPPPGAPCRSESVDRVAGRVSATHSPRKSFSSFSELRVSSWTCGETLPRRPRRFLRARPVFPRSLSRSSVLAWRYAFVSRKPMTAPSSA
jgi:hypothetical protein